MAFGKPALGYANTQQSAHLLKFSMYGTMSLAPRAQFKPTAIGLAWLTEFQNASFVWPDKVLSLIHI